MKKKKHRVDGAELGKASHNTKTRLSWGLLLGLSKLAFVRLRISWFQWVCCVGAQWRQYSRSLSERTCLWPSPALLYESPQSEWNKCTVYWKQIRKRVNWTNLVCNTVTMPYRVIPQIQDDLPSGDQFRLVWNTLDVWECSQKPTLGEKTGSRWKRCKIFPIWLTSFPSTLYSMLQLGPMKISQLRGRDWLFCNHTYY